MRKITEEAIHAFLNNREYKKDNTEINGHGYFLHGNKIAEWNSLSIVPTRHKIIIITKMYEKSIYQA